MLRREPLHQVEHHAREEAGFCDAEKEPEQREAERPAGEHHSSGDERAVEG